MAVICDPDRLVFFFSFSHSHFMDDLEKSEAQIKKMLEYKHGLTVEMGIDLFEMYHLMANPQEFYQHCNDVLELEPSFVKRALRAGKCISS